MVNLEFWNQKRVFVTGHTGFKGGWLVTWLLEMGAQVMGYALKPDTDPSYFVLCGLEDRLRSVIGDVREKDALQNAMQSHQPEIVFHLAAQSIVRRSYSDPVRTFATNVIGTVHLLDVVRAVPSVHAVVIVTSDKCYENREWVWGYREDEPIGGRDPYSASKGCAELATAAYRRSFFQGVGRRVGVATVRAGNVIGGGDWGEDRLVPDAVRALGNQEPLLVRNPQAVRPWQHVLEPLAGYLMLAERLYKEGEKWAGAWNFGPEDKDVRPVRWLVERITEMWGNSASWKIDQGNNPYEAHYLKLDCSKAKSKLGWYPQWDLELSLEKTVNWYKAYFNHEDMLNITINQIHSYEERL